MIDNYMAIRFLKIHPADNVYVALTDLKAGESITQNGFSVALPNDVQAKHKFVEKALQPEEDIIMYGCLVGKALKPIPDGGVIGTHNVKHKASQFAGKTQNFHWTPPDVNRWKNKTFQGFHRSDGRVGTANYWVVIPMVFCENRNVNVIRQAFEEELGFGKHDAYKDYVRQLVQLYRDGKINKIPTVPLANNTATEVPRLFKNIDGIKFLTHEGGCGGTRQD